MRLRAWAFLLAILVAVWIAGSGKPAGFARQPSPQAGIIRVNTLLVRVPVSVTDETGHPVKDLQADDFTLEENGSPVPISHFGEPGESHLDMVLVFDLTGSVFGEFKFERHAAISFLQSLFRPGDVVSILCIEDKPSVVLERSNSLTEALAGLNALEPTGSATAFFDSVIAAANLLRASTDPETRRVQVVLSDGEDNWSERHLSDALREVQQADCIFYSINPGGPSIHLNKVSLRGQQAMESLAEQTGGAGFLAADNQEALSEIYGRIATELQAQYLISYYSLDSRMDGSFRRIAVHIPKRPQLHVRARQGYYAVKPSAR